VILVDSSGWIEFFADDPRADRYAPYLKRPDEVVTPTVVLFEVYRKLRRERGEEFALAVVAQMKRTCLVTLSETIALEAGDLSLRHSLSMADAFILATARQAKCPLVTSDAHFQGLVGVTYIP
jgi:predicted nucleic acid-binding protein